MLHPGAPITFETSGLPSSSGKRCLLGLWEKRCRILKFTPCKLTGQHMDPQQLGTTELPSQGNRFCLLVYPASKNRAQLNGHTHKHTEDSELKPQHEENKNSWDQRAAWEKEME